MHPKPFYLRLLSTIDVGSILASAQGTCRDFGTVGRFMLLPRLVWSTLIINRPNYLFALP